MLPLILGLLAIVLGASSSLHADILELNDGNLIECKFVKMVKKGRGDVIVVADEEGKEKQYSKSRVKSFIRTKKTSWEDRAEREQWYEAKAKKVLSVSMAMQEDRVTPWLRMLSAKQPAACRSWA